MKIEKYIRELLLWNDCVIIPGLGGFVTNYLPVEINTSKHLFTPPSKKITFNKSLKNNDGLLANHIAITENISFYQAVNIIEEAVISSLEILNKGKRISIKEIGVLYFNKEQNLQFEPSNETNLLIDSFGLTDFHSPLIKREPLYKKIEKQFKDRPAVGSERKSKFKKWAVTIAALPVLAAMAWLPLKTDVFYDLSVNYSSLIPFSSSSAPVFTPREDHASFNLVESSDELDQAEFLINSEEIIVIEDVTTKESIEVLDEAVINVAAKTNIKEIAIPESNDNFHVIAGCFGVIENAEKMISKLKSNGYNAKIVDQNKGFYRVSYKGFNTKEEAIDLLVSLKSQENKSAWILTKE
ncbi:MAG: SPOR domain-containing protein [Bacteroidota bacterium]|nr:SPOR domain-containing protein [Bacteroidota bacterium]